MMLTHPAGMKDKYLLAQRRPLDMPQKSVAQNWKDGEQILAKL